MARCRRRANFAYDEARLQASSRAGRSNPAGAREYVRIGQHRPGGELETSAARLEIADGQLDAAGAAIDRAAAITAKSLPSGHPFEIDVLEGKADVAAARGDLAGVERYDREAQALADKLFGQDHPVHIAAVDRLVNILWINGERAEAEKTRRSELTNVQRKLGDNNPDTARAMRNLAAVFANSPGQIDDAVPFTDAHSRSTSRRRATSHREVARDDLALASTLIVVGRFDEAQTALKRARSVGDKQGDLY